MFARRVFLLGLGASVACVATAQVPPRGRLVIGWLTTSPHPMLASFRDGLRTLGYVEGANLEIRLRYAEGVPERLPELARELASGGVDIIVASGVTAMLAVRVATPDQRAACVATATVRGIATMDADAGSAGDIEPALLRAPAAGVDGVIVLSSPLFAARRDDLVATAARLRLPVIHEHRLFTEAGGLISYGPDLGAIFRRLAGYADRLARGTDPADMPVEQPTVFQLIINLKTAKTLGLDLPALLLARADEVIE